MANEYAEIVLRLVSAVVVGGLIGIERSYHGRPAGFRTHTLVCIASALLMMVTVYESQWFVSGRLERVVVDPTRMAQGIMTGIGFLGAGVIMKEGLSVRGLTTAASIWITAAIGILVGIGFYFPAGLATALTLGTLSTFRWIENRMPAQFYAHFMVRFQRHGGMPEPELRRVVTEHGFSIANLTYRLTGEGKHFEYRMVVRTLDPDNLRALSETLNGLPTVLEYRIAPTGD
ncbi:MAG TPA: MgtC/SapB family protein [Burkholderiales bacterium]|jgi:putative Mg2+ transporter-C (MgtC) family protein|nr:MgtC/SapB family protein [Burkholderiales bacterium]